MSNLSALNAVEMVNSSVTEVGYEFANNVESRGNGEKVLAMVTLGLGSFLFGMLPALISERNRRRFPLTTSLLLCFGAGILLATAVVHILPEVRKQMSSNFAEIALCGGFFLIYFIDELIHYFVGDAAQRPPEPTLPATTETHSHRSYGALGTGVESLLQTNNATDHNRTLAVSDSNDSSQSNANFAAHSQYQEIAEVNTIDLYPNHNEPCTTQAMTGTLGLFIALSLHSTIEGLAIGVQNSSTRVLFLLGAVACHKFVMGFCLGLEFRSDPNRTIRSQIIGVGVFALGAICGIGVGMLIVDIPSTLMTTTLPIIQGLAGGTLFYVTVCEVIPREKGRWHQNTARKAAGLAQFFAIFFGFAIMCLINYYFEDDDET